MQEFPTLICPITGQELIPFLVLIKKNRYGILYIMASPFKDALLYSSNGQKN